MSRKYGAVGLLLALAALALAGCTGSNPLNTGNNGYEVVITTSPNTTQYSTMVVNIRDIRTLPEDPDAAAVLDTDVLSLLGGRSVSVDFNAPFDQAPASTLPVGSYTVTRLTMTGLTLRSTAVPANASVCEDYIVGQINATGTYNMTLFSGDANFDVTQASTGTLSIGVDAAALRDAAYAAVNCGNCSPANCDTVVPVDPNCRCFQIGAFASTPFRALSDTFLTVQ